MTLALRVVVGVCLAGSVVAQGGTVLGLTLLLVDGPLAWQGLVVLPTLFLAVVCLQVVGVCVWRLLTMVRRGTVFTAAALRHVDRVVGAIAVLAVLVTVLPVVAVVSNRTQPGDAVAPGVVGLALGASVVLAGVALVVLAQRLLLAQAVARDAETRALQAELDGVI
ncbi:DUF2975 domain-containing protein [Nocardioides sp. CFH 31398]|uniref:DUF2975 domain-containing protein n=1 Tax=Nocardioides sp. CFH 31398 TaxID=2919579 RepID=UPI001F05BBB1|nr:DUF2975 domain-containing protein [Nocardioides sp. CFH 31398]MCH1867978.1 DUF2975 domain-containing protein [Nocardioides sp. CFH 31398]